MAIKTSIVTDLQGQTDSSFSSRVLSSTVISDLQGATDRGHLGAPTRGIVVDGLGNRVWPPNDGFATDPYPTV